MRDQEKTGGKPPEDATSIPEGRPVRAVVGIGASAGGLDAFSLLLKAMPVDTGMAFVLVQHLDARHPSSLRDILARVTPMPVLEATEGLRVQADHVVVIPPNAEMTVLDGAFHLEGRSRSSSPRPVDVLLRSLATEFGDHAIGVVLSGTGSDGSEGLLAIKDAGGITFAQDPLTADSPGMPATAVAVGAVDFVLAPEAVAAELVRLARLPREASSPARAEARPTALRPAMPADQLRAVCDLMHEATGIDFSLYRESTVLRRLARRLSLTGIGDLESYLTKLATDPEERDAFQRDLLIGVTRFFREPESFEALARKVFPELLRGRTAGNPVRIWVPGCSTGEEAYSILIAFEEFQLAQGTSFPVQLFASDISEAAIETARAGVYPEGIAQDIGPERLARCFTRVAGGYRIANELRARCVFSRHNLLDDPPFSRLDLISCRNVLIYLEAVRKTIVPLFHYALLDHGFLMLGRSESARFPYLFEPIESRLRIYRKVHAEARPARTPAWTGSVRLRGEAERSLVREKLASLSLPADLGREADRVLLSRYGPAAIVLGPSREVLEVRGDAAPFLRLPSGALSFHIGRLLADTGLFLEVEALLVEAARSGGPVRREHLPWESDGALGEVDVEVLPLEVRGHHGHLVVFEPRREEEGRREAATGAGPAGEDAALDRMARLERELRAARQRVVEMIGEHDASEQESQRVLEDALSSNEELQSLAEEMETAKEELRCTNEELVSVNAELEVRNQALASARHLASAIVENIGLPLLVLDGQLRIGTVNPSFTSTFGVEGGSAQGQSLFAAWGGAWDIPGLRAMLEKAALSDASSFGPFETSVHFGTAGPHAVVVLGCRLRGHDRILLSVQDVTARKRAEKALHDSEERQAQAEKMEIVGRLAGGIAHDFNNLLTVVIGHCDLLALRLAGSPLAADHVDPLRQSAERAAMLTDQLLTFSRRKVVQPSDLDLGALLEEFERMLRRVLGEHIEIVLRVPTGLWRVHADNGEIGRVVMNLALNARDAMPGGGRLELEVRNRVFGADGDAPAGLPAGRYVELTVQDNGPGVEPELKEHIFEPFFTTKGNSRGTGLGLPTVQAIVQGCSGAVTCESAAGGGTRMTVLLPALEEGKVAPAAEALPLGAVARGNHEVVLLVEDDPALRQIARHVLEATGYQVIEAVDGHDGLRRLAEQRRTVDLLLTDVVMPEMGGRELAERAVAERPGLKVLFMSGHTEDMLLKAGVGHGAPFLHKPFSPDQLARKVREVLDGR